MCPTSLLARLLAEQGWAAVAEVQAIAELALVMLGSGAVEAPKEAATQPPILEAIATDDIARIIAVVNAAFAKAAREAST